MPDRVRIPLKQHVGAPCTPTVAPGQYVRVGDEIGAVPDNALGAAVHASMNGTVAAVADGYVEIGAAEGR
jgi:Na+-translocating ferredoxin:NAD+ oxidoreductase RnfC subunit